MKKNNVGVILIIAVLISFVCGALGAYIIMQRAVPTNVIVGVSKGSVNYSEDNSIAEGVSRIYDSVVE